MSSLTVVYFFPSPSSFSLLLLPPLSASSFSLFFQPPPSPYFFSLLLLLTLSASSFSLLFQPPPSPYSFSLLPPLSASSFNVFLLLLLPYCAFTLPSLLPILLPLLPFSSSLLFKHNLFYFALLSSPHPSLPSSLLPPPSLHSPHPTSVYLPSFIIILTLSILLSSQV